MARMNDFITKLKEEAQKQDEDVIYSKPITETRVIPPEEITIKQLDVPSIRVLPPKEEEKKNKPVFKIRPKTPPIIEEPKSQISEEPIIEKPIQQEVKQEEISNIVSVNKEEELQKKIEYLFMHSETDAVHKETWVETYLKAQKSTKDNIFARAIKRGKFSITRDGKIEILPEYETYGKSANDILKDKWL